MCTFDRNFNYLNMIFDVVSKIKQWFHQSTSFAKVAASQIQIQSISENFETIMLPVSLT